MPGGMLSFPALFWFRFTRRRKKSKKTSVTCGLTLFFSLFPSFAKISLKGDRNFKTSPVSLDTTLVYTFLESQEHQLHLRSLHFSDATAWRAHDLDPPKIGVAPPNTAAVIFFQPTNVRCHFNTGLHPLLWRPGLALTY